MLKFSTLHGVLRKYDAQQSIDRASLRISVMEGYEVGETVGAAKEE
jgi:hypothetical protein